MKAPQGPGHQITKSRRAGCPAVKAAGAERNQQQTPDAKKQQQVCPGSHPRTNERAARRAPDAQKVTQTASQQPPLTPPTPAAARTPSTPPEDMETASRANPFQSTRELRRSVAIHRYDEPVTSDSFPGRRPRHQPRTGAALSPQIETAVEHAAEVRRSRAAPAHTQRRRLVEDEDAESLRQIISDQRRRISELEAENERLRADANLTKVLGGRPGALRVQSAADARQEPPGERFVGSQTPTRAHAESRRDGALQRATRQRVQRREPVGQRDRYAAPPPGTPPPPDGEPPPTPRGEIRIKNEPIERQSRMRRARDEQRTREDLARTTSVPAQEDPLTIYIAHDNVPLGRAMVQGQSDVLIETKHASGKLCFVYGRVGYSGPCEDAPCTGALQVGSRGCWVLSLDGCYARCVDVATKCRLSNFECLSLLEGETIPFSTPDECRSFFRGCTSRVDVVLAPQRLRDDGKPPKSMVSVGEAPFLPYWDNDTPPRRLAPQFRSAGVGYIRLGDDMSRNGLSFISCDASTFLLDAGHDAAPPASLTSRARLRSRDEVVDPSPLARSRKGGPPVHQL